MSVAVITGSAGLIGSEAASHFAGLGYTVLGIDNDMRRVFFGEEASTDWNRRRLEQTLGRRYRHYTTDIRNPEELNRVFAEVGSAIKVVIHTAAQPSHDWAARDPQVDFAVNANGTLNVLEATRKFAPDAAFVFTSTNKVYGDTPNRLPLQELETRWEIEARHPYARGIREDMSVDKTLHSVFGASKLAADMLVQEYGRYFGLRTACFRCGCLTGPHHAGTELHGFLAYLMKCTMTGTLYTVYGYRGKQVRDNIHSSDLIAAFDAFCRAPRMGEVYNLGGGRHSNCSILEAIKISQGIAGCELTWKYTDTSRIGDHIWWISDNGRFAEHYPAWRLTYDVGTILGEICEQNRDRWRSRRPPASARLQSATPSTKRNVLGVWVDAVDYRATVDRIVECAERSAPLAVSALAVHGVMTGVLDPMHRHRLNRLDLVVADGQPVRWALNWLHGAHLDDRVRGPTLMLKVCAVAAARGLPIYLYGSRAEVLTSLQRCLVAKFPRLVIAGAEASKFRRLSGAEKQEAVDRIRSSGAKLTLVGLGCPRQEVWAYEYREALGMPIIAVGAAFDVHAGFLKEAPRRLQEAGLEWAYRLYREPRRLWRRYVLLNPIYLGHVALQLTGLRHYDPADAPAPRDEMGYG